MLGIVAGSYLQNMLSYIFISNSSILNKSAAMLNCCLSI